MRISCAAGVLASFLWLSASIASAQVAKEDLTQRLRRLEKEIAAVRGLGFKTPVKAKVVPRPVGTDKKLQGYYSAADKTLMLFNDVSSAYETGVLIHEMVHALQDQHFDLGKLKAKLHLESYGSDAELALAALIEGDATLTMIELLKKDQPKVGAMLDVPLEKAKNLHNAFLYAQGARYVKALKDKGGWKSVNFAYKFPPRSTASIFNLGGVAVIDLGPGKTMGAFQLFQTLRASTLGSINSEAFDVAKAWRGDRGIEVKEGGIWIMACADADKTLLAQKLLRQLHRGQISEGVVVRQAPGEDIWVNAGKVHAVLVRGQRVLVVEAPNHDAFVKLLDRAEGPLGLEVYTAKDKTLISFGDMIERLLKADAVCIGEAHDAELHHRVQAQVIKALFARDERLGVGLEMFQRPFQAALDRYVHGDVEAAAFLKESEYQQRWGYDWSLYSPIVDFCRKNGLPVAALNAGRELTSRISKVGYAALNEEEKKQLGPIDFNFAGHRDYWYERLAKLHGNPKATPEEKERGYQVMATWDDFMARSAVEFQKARNVRRMVILAGSGHIERGFGIPQRVARLGNFAVATVGVVVGSDPTKERDWQALTDYVVIVK